MDFSSYLLKKGYALDLQKKPFFLTSLDEHTMGSAVLQYIDIKMHHYIKEKKYKRVVVVGEYDRNCEVSKYEKTGKLTNWQRPTAQLLDDGVLLIKCFPGSDYVRHYAALIASYLSLHKKDSSIVSYILPSENDCFSAIHNLHLEDIPKGDAVVLGYGLPEIAEVDFWQGTDQYLWAEKMIHGKKVIFIIFMFSYWGDILGRITSTLVRNRYKKLLFTAKVGGINKKYTPNVSLVTGNKTYLEGQIVQWDNVFESYKHPDLHKAFHCNSSSVLFETHEWFSKMCLYDIVESEIGHFAKAAKDGGVDFGYLHFISNTLSSVHEENLSNEREPHILEKREKLKKKIRNILFEVV